jgi:hypothetical protein
VVGRTLHLTVVALLLAAPACRGSDDDAQSSARPVVSPPTSVARARASTSTTTVTPTTTPAPAATAAPTIVEVRYRVEVRSADPAVADFPAVVEQTLRDPRGWNRARFDLRREADAPYAVVIAEPDDAQELCRPYDVYRAYSCQNGPTVVINAERWREATPQWTGDLATYRQMLVNHEFGHLLGQRHPRVQCPQAGEPAAVMAQQSTELNGCLPNAWPLEWEVELAARHDRALAPAYGE